MLGTGLRGRYHRLLNPEPRAAADRILVVARRCEDVARAPAAALRPPGQAPTSPGRRPAAASLVAAQP
jgi:hypothetical protein